MQLRKLDKSVLKLWYIRAGILALALVAALIGLVSSLILTEAPREATLSVSIGVGVPIVLVVILILAMPILRYKMYSWGYDEKRIIVEQGVVFRHRVVIPVCQIQDLHRIQGPLMIILHLGGVTISTAGSNFDISTLTTEEADSLIDDLEKNLEARVEELKNEEV